MELKEQLVRLVESNLKSDEHFLVDIVIKGTEQFKKVIVLLDGDNGVNIDDCASLSRALGAALEEQDPFSGQYTLEVSSAGLDHPLSLKRQYYARIGKELALKLADGEELQGELLKVSANDIVINKTTKDKKRQITEETKVAFKDIEKAMVMVSFK